MKGWLIRHLLPRLYLGSPQVVAGVVLTPNQRNLFSIGAGDQIRFGGVINAVGWNPTQAELRVLKRAWDETHP